MEFISPRGICTLVEESYSNKPISFLGGVSDRIRREDFHRSLDEMYPE